MIPVGTLCYLRSELPGDAKFVGRVGEIIKHGPYSHSACGRGLIFDCRCLRGDTVCVVKIPGDTVCVDSWACIIPIAPPGTDVDTSTPRELVTA